ncbi:hypothetical protein B0J12DRAFT_238657 [Macrophomina phaseolina]|uniref:N-acetyltransferase domain-containing protein n=1 Tax=Macrophomina phaseolina TaxID=35725 RepID=A0ABQ8GQM2_9PEZI|nr:hypothetical protein B0J12DRAFT_238657 [Macrophomina phaseolina]
MAVPISVSDMRIGCSSHILISGIGLSLLVTASEYRRRGTASLIIQWGIDKADEVGIEVYVDSSEARKQVYEKFGFRALKRIEFNMSQLGYEGMDVHTSMLRPPQARS